MNALGQAIGDLCKAILPIPEEYYLGNPDSSIAVCTLSSIALLKSLADSKIFHSISIVGRLLSENKGIDEIVKHAYKNQHIIIIIVCGKEVWGHKAGHSLFKLHKNGVNPNKKIIGSTSPDPFLTVSKTEIEHFQNNVTLVNLINETNHDMLVKKIQKTILP